MAEIISNHIAGKNKRKILSTRVDLTPMVDLGFLLLTFFVFCSSMQLSKSLKLIVPDDHVKTDATNNVKENGALTLLLGTNNLIYYYNGLPKEDHSNWHTSNLMDIRNVILQKKKNTPADDFVVLIKPGDKSNYAALVNILDEMKINLVERYNLVEPDLSEKKNLDIIK
jgi:biopolymer transport protein ExbD